MSLSQFHLGMFLKDIIIFQLFRFAEHEFLYINLPYFLILLMKCVQNILRLKLYLPSEKWTVDETFIFFKIVPYFSEFWIGWNISQTPFLTWSETPLLFLLTFHDIHFHEYLCDFLHLSCFLYGILLFWLYPRGNDMLSFILNIVCHDWFQWFSFGLFFYFYVLEEP